MLRVCLTLLLMLCAAQPASGQEYGRPTTPAVGLQLSRDTLQKLLTSYEATAKSPLYSRQLRERARQEAELIRERLTAGDIQVGDRVYLLVERHAELSDTFAVLSGRKVVLAEIGDVPLQGVLRSELQQYFQQFLSKYIVNPVVQANSLVRLQLSGTVARPGLYDVPADLRLSDVLTLAGGTGPTAALDRISVVRRNDRIWDGEALRTAMIEGRTVDQLSLRAGDIIDVPGKRRGLEVLRSLWYVIPVVTLILNIAN